MRYRKWRNRTNIMFLQINKCNLDWWMPETAYALAFNDCTKLFGSKYYSNDLHIETVLHLHETLISFTSSVRYVHIWGTRICDLITPIASLLGFGSANAAVGALLFNRKSCNTSSYFWNYAPEVEMSINQAAS